MHAIGYRRGPHPQGQQRQHQHQQATPNGPALPPPPVCKLCKRRIRLDETMDQHNLRCHADGQRQPKRSREFEEMRAALMVTNTRLDETTKELATLRAEVVRIGAQAEPPSILTQTALPMVPTTTDTLTPTPSPPAACCTLSVPRTMRSHEQETSLSLVSVTSARHNKQYWTATVFRDLDKVPKYIKQQMPPCANRAYVKYADSAKWDLVPERRIRFHVGEALKANTTPGSAA